MKLKFENVDVEQCLRSVMERNTKHYQSDFEFDVGSMERIAQTKHPERTPLYWMSRTSGTWCFRERDIFIRDSDAFYTWQFYKDTRDTILAYTVEITGIEGDAIKGNLYTQDYLEAVESKMVTGAEQEEYIRVAMEKAHHLKDFVTALFEWVKLDAGEQIFHFEVCDLNELSRDIMADWVPLLESHDLTYEIEIPETEYMTRVDPTAYTRILNNLLQNILTHSGARQVTLTVTETEQQAKIIVADNGKGISAADLPHIFERMYQCDHSRSAKGNGLGLSIAKELVSVHKGTITADSILEAGTTFTIILPKAL